MAKLTKFFYVMIHFISLLLITTNVHAYDDCYNHAECKTKIKCVLPRIAECVRFKCDCVRLNVPRTPWSTRPENAHKPYKEE
ncbi:Nodule Cysteine-Rich (NCR) secreted peptide [Medicago truncatula]|uniref:Nodule Cysteine-Rich (NCR) secreted peptide n=1 Tax=Medicago truncatula TaxID=3880 RepID=A0A072V8H8_MEDTR|nr:Nodule Cysteine-Rich (NCR) secreted peptide [Medicago truncatula]